MKFNDLIPELVVKDLNRSLNFYLKILGFKVEYDRKGDKFAFLSYEGCQIMIQERNGTWETAQLEYPFGRGVNFQARVKNVRLLLQRLSTSNYPLKEGLKENWYKVGKNKLGNREFLVMDPDGYLLRFFEDMGKK